MMGEGVEAGGGETAPMTSRTRVAADPQPHGAVPSARQQRWHDLEAYGFVHFSINTFTDKEWGYGDESPSLFAPTDFDAGQIVGAAKDGGLKGIVLTAKHHDGFCLWPSRHTRHSVAASPWRNGKGDMVREFADACRRQGLRFGVYLSPWDRNHAEYGRPAYLEYYRAQLRELLTGYGPIFEVWFDGANGGDGHYGGARETRTIDNRTYYDWPTTWKMVRELQPDACLFSDAGPDCRWVGNESGFAGDPCWSTIDNTGQWPGHADSGHLNRGDRDGADWIPAEVDVSIRPGWFWHASQNDKVKTAAQLRKIWFESVGRGANLILNLPPDRRGRLHERDATALREHKRWLDATFAVDQARGAKASATHSLDAKRGARSVCDGRASTYWCSGDTGGAVPEVVLELAEPSMVSLVRLKEHLPLGERIDEATVEMRVDGAWKAWGATKHVGPRCWIGGTPVRAEAVRVRIPKAAASPALTELALFREP